MSSLQRQTKPSLAVVGDIEKAQVSTLRIEL